MILFKSFYRKKIRKIFIKLNSVCCYWIYRFKNKNVNKILSTNYTESKILKKQKKKNDNDLSKDIRLFQGVKKKKKDN